MNLSRIRQKTAWEPNKLPNPKEGVRAWLREIHSNYPIALTLTLKQFYLVKTVNGSYYKKLDFDECRRIAKSFTHKLNQRVFGSRAAKIYGKGLKYIIAVEGLRSSRNLHLHMAIGNFPKHIKWNEIHPLVVKAKSQVSEIDDQYDLSIADSGWNEYLVKELTKSNTDSILWDLA